MALLIIKKGDKNFVHYPTGSDWVADFSFSWALAKSEDDSLVLAEPNGKKFGLWDYADVTIEDETDGSPSETFGSIIQLMQKLIGLGYPTF